jgi:hypothetical protein
MRRLDDFRLQMGRHELVPIVIGGMGVDISSADLALQAARLGGVGHISDAMVKTVTDRRYKTKFVKAKQALYKANVGSDDKSMVKFDLGDLAEATRLHVESTMSRKQGSGMILHQLHGKAHHERAQGDAEGAHEFGPGCRHRWHHPGRGPAPGFLRADRRPPALSRCQAGHHRVVAARLAAVPEEEQPPQPPARLHRGGRPAGRRPPGFWHGLGAVRPGHHRGRDPAVPEDRRAGDIP